MVTVSPSVYFPFELQVVMILVNQLSHNWVAPQNVVRCTAWRRLTKNLLNFILDTQLCVRTHCGLR